MTRKKRAMMENRISSPGMLLRGAREAKEWSIQHVAERLNLASQRIAELEADDYHLVPSLTYVKGYLRSYARLLGLIETEVMDEFNALGLAEEEKVNPVLQPALEQAKPPLNLKWLRWVSFFGIVSLILGVSLWFGSH